MASGKKKNRNIDKSDLRAKGLIGNKSKTIGRED